MAGGDMMLYQQIMEQKMMLRQQQWFMRQQQLLMKQQKSDKKGTQPGASLNAPEAAGIGGNPQPGVASTYRRKNKLRGNTGSGTPKPAVKRGSGKASALAKNQGTASPVAAKGADASSSSSTHPVP